MKKLLIYLCVLAICSVVWAEEKKAEEQEKEKPDCRSVIVNAWLVKVDADALYKSGVKPLSEKEKENVSIMNLLWCLGDPNDSEIIASARTQAGINETGQTSLQKTEYIERIHEENSVEFTPYQQTVNFETLCVLFQDKRIRIEYGFKSETFDQDDEDEFAESPLDTVHISAVSIAFVVANKPAIVAQTQVGDDIFFLVLRAEIVE